MWKRAGVVIGSLALLIPIGVGDAGASTTVDFYGTAQRQTVPIGTPPSTCPGEWRTSHVRFLLQDQNGHTWTLAGDGCGKAYRRYGGGGRSRGVVRLQREGSSLPALIGKYRSESGSYKLMSRSDNTLKLRKEDRPPPREKVRGTVTVTENCGYDSQIAQNVCSATFSGTLTVDPSYVS